MPSPRQAFEVAVALNVVGIFFDTAALITAVRSYAQGDLAERVGEQADALKAHRRQAKTSIDKVEASLPADTMPEAPQQPDAYAEWAQACSELVYAQLDDPAVRPYLAGWYLGAWLQAANLIALSLYLGDAAPHDEYLGEVVGSYATNTHQALSDLAQLIEQADDSLSQDLLSAHALLAEVPAPAVGDNALEIAGAYQETLESLDGLLQGIAQRLDG